MHLTPPTQKVAVAFNPSTPKIRGAFNSPVQKKWGVFSPRQNVGVDLTPHPKKISTRVRRYFIQNQERKNHVIDLLSLSSSTIELSK